MCSYLFHSVNGSLSDVLQSIVCSIFFNIYKTFQGTSDVHRDFSELIPLTYTNQLLQDRLDADQKLVFRS